MQVAQEFGKPNHLHRRQIGIEAAAGERCRLGERVCFEHLHETGVASGIKPLSRRHEQDRGEPIRR